MRLREVVSLFRENRASAVAVLLNAGGTELGHGIDRYAYSIPGSRFVVKVAAQTGKFSQTEKEIEAIKKLRSGAVPELRPFVPRVAFADAELGIVLMERLKPYRHTANDSPEVIAYRQLGEVEDKLTSTGKIARCTDFHCGNVGFTRKGKLKIIDFGFLTVHEA